MRSMSLWKTTNSDVAKMEETASLDILLDCTGGRIRYSSHQSVLGQKVMQVCDIA